ncbi:CDK-activating kinase assembly factor MAT1 [Cinnamomum micranthum f. kanehirae]|uniref:CDK-activating kinase assembly factor MAT1 n=1 Tax=Cinnamomum micranthum f. kanehirae TaxID=337451 RepID=A0A3S3MLS7_9MAGN|nr:CDK-activating kinase assembly factor MAT1 [Cinnamomum micranthum f. kanehirae]
MVVASGTNAYAKEMAIRKRIANIRLLSDKLTFVVHRFNKREDDFPSLKDYNDYLEEVEDMTFNLVEGIDTAAIEAKIAKYQEENAEQIINARARKAEELAAALKASKGNSVQAETTDGAAGQSLQAGGVQGQYAPAVAGAAFTQPRPTGMMPHVQPGPVGGGSEIQGSLGFDEETQKLRAERGARAGGWTVELSKRRAFEEAFGSMWI